ncbi:MAG TPA: glycosyltransferase family 9 protein [Azospirillum sp.]
MTETVVIQPHPGIGDTVWQVPALRAIAAQLPEGRFDLIARPQAQAGRLFAAEPMVAAVHPLLPARGAVQATASFLRLVATLRAGRYRRAYILHRNPRYGFAALLAGVPERIGYRPPGPLHGLTRAVDAGPMVKGVVDLLDALDHFLPRAGIPEVTRIPRLAVLPEARAAVHERWGRLARPWVVVGVGANGADRRWSDERFAALVDGLAAAGAGTVFLLGSPAEAGTVAGVRALARRDTVPVTDLTLDRVLALLAEADLFVGNDSGPMNMAAAVGRPTFGMIGSNDSRVPIARLPTLTPILPPGGLSPDGMQRLLVEHVLPVVASAVAAAVATPPTQVPTA